MKIKKLFLIKVITITGIIALTMGLFSPKALLAQHHEEETEHVFKNERKNILMLSWGYTYVPKGTALHHQSDGIFVPSVGLDYKRRVSEKWAISSFLDWELDHYLISHKEFSRDKAFIAVFGMSYEIIEGLGAFAGVGGEFEDSHNLWVFRIGLESGLHLGKHWVLVPSIFYDWKENYSTYSFSLGLSFKF